MTSSPLLGVMTPSTFIVFIRILTNTLLIRALNNNLCVFSAFKVRQSTTFFRIIFKELRKTETNNPLSSPSSMITTWSFYILLLAAINPTTAARYYILFATTTLRELWALPLTFQTPNNIWWHHSYHYFVICKHGTIEQGTMLFKKRSAHVVREYFWIVP